MKKNMLEILRNHAKKWEINIFGPPSETTEEKILEIYLKLPDYTALVGRMWFESGAQGEQGEYIFRYDPSYDGNPIFAFPDKERVYRSRVLWPFFSVRIPPFNRQDMRDAMAERSLEEDQIIEILGSIARTSMTNPYEFRLS